MTGPSTARGRRVRLLVLITALLAGPVSAQPSSIPVKFTSAGPVGISELRFLLGSDVQFQIFDFEAKEGFCLLFGYRHEINGESSSSRSADRGFCNIAGRQRLIVMMRLEGDTRSFSFTVNDRDTGMGGGNELVKLPIGRDIGGWATFRAEESIHADRDTTLFRWRYGPNPPNPVPHHDVHILVRLQANDRGLIGTWYER